MQLINSILRRNLAAFIEKSFHTINPGTEFMPNWHIEEIARRLTEVTKGKTRRLIINIPPRYLKSICVNVAWPAWMLGNIPHKRIISASFNQGLANKHSLDTRLIMSADWYQENFPNFGFSDSQNEKNKFMTTQNGFRLATSVFGSITGEGGNILIVDDPMSPEMAASANERRKVQTWFDQTFSTRLDNKKRGAIVLVMQRLHEDDLSGVLLRRGGWEHLSLPAMTEDGHMLHEEREGWDELQEMRSTLGEYGFAAQYQQEPIALEAGMIRRVWLKYYVSQKELPKFDRIVQSWDTAIKSTAKADYSVGITFGIAENQIYVLDLMRVQMEFPDLRREIIAAAEKWDAGLVMIEDKASGQSLLQDLRRTTKIPVLGVIPKYDKLTRMSSVSPMIESGRLHLDRRAYWLRDFGNSSGRGGGTMSKILEYQKAVFAVLSGDSTLSGKITGVYDIAPQGAAAPYVYFGDVETEDATNLAEDMQRISFVIFCISESAGKMEAAEISQAVRDLLHLQSLEVNGFEHVNTRNVSEDVSLSSNGTTYQARLEFEAFVAG